jgi:biofilm PGA synthesis N-glycosyltransferase PgaC
MWPVFLDYFASLVWSYTILFVFLLWLLEQFILLPEMLRSHIYMPDWLGLLFGMTFALQFVVSMVIDSRYEKDVGKTYYWLIWYPMVYWLISVSTAIVAFPKALFKRSGARAVWTSPDRGLR